MPQPALDQLMALNDQLSALIEAGVPMETGLPLRANDLQAQLQAINANVAREVSRGATLDDALSAAPPLYGSIVRTGLHAGQLPIALRSFHRLAESRSQTLEAATFSLVYPALVLLLAYLGLVFFCLWLVPTLQEMYFSAGLAPRRALSILAALRETLPYWIVFPPLGIAAVVIIGRRARKYPHTGWLALRRRLPGLMRANREIQAANFAQLLAALVESDVPISEALAMAAGAWEDHELAAATRRLAGAMSAPRGGIDPLPAAAVDASYPPLLKWAILDAEAVMAPQTALRQVADTYRASAQRRLDRWSLAAPLLLCVVVGGGATLLYGLALFVPIVDLLKGLAR
jgi:general secretion pathway protein F